MQPIPYPDILEFPVLTPWTNRPLKFHLCNINKTTCLEVPFHVINDGERFSDLPARFDEDWARLSEDGVVVDGIVARFEAYRHFGLLKVGAGPEMPECKVRYEAQEERDEGERTS